MSCPWLGPSFRCSYKAVIESSWPCRPSLSPGLLDLRSERLPLPGVASDRALGRCPDNDTPDQSLFRWSCCGADRNLSRRAESREFIDLRCGRLGRAGGGLAWYDPPGDSVSGWVGGSDPCAAVSCVAASCVAVSCTAVTLLCFRWLREMSTVMPQQFPMCDERARAIE